MGFSASQAARAVNACRESDCALYVNYIRRSDVGVNEIYRRLRNGEIRGPVKGVVWYSKGLFNSASHFVNLLQYLFGGIESSQVVDSGRLWENHDPEPDFELLFECGKFKFMALPAENFFHNTLEVIASNGRLRYESGGQQIIWQKTTSNGMFSGYTTLQQESEFLASDFGRIQWHVADELAAAIESKPARICSGADALQTLEVLEDIKEAL